MALLTLFINKPQSTTIKRSVANAPAPMVLDAQISESFKADAEATEHPIEDDSDITDHVITKAKQLTITGIITENPLNLGASLAGAATTVGSLVGSSLAKKLGGSGLSAIGGVGGGIVSGFAGKTLSTVLGLTPSGNRLAMAIDELVAVRDDKSPVTIQTGLTKYDNYILTGIQVDRDQSSGRSFKVQLTFKEIIKVSSLTVKVNVPKITSGLPKKNLGSQATNVASDAQKKGSSVLLNVTSSATNAIKGLF